MRQAFLLQAPAMLGMMLLGFVVYVGVMGSFTGLVQGELVEAITRVPTIYAYDAAGNRISVITPEVQQAADPLLAQRDRVRADRDLYQQTADYDGLTRAEEELDRIAEELEKVGYYDLDISVAAMYQMFAYPSATILAGLIVFSAATHFWETGFGLWRSGASRDMLKASVFGLAAILIVPEIWDVYAISMTNLALFMLDPVGGNPQQVVDGLWCKMGSGGCMYDFAGVLDPLSWSTALASPGNFGQTLLGEVLMPFFMLTPVLILSLGIFVVAKVRIIFIMIVLITLPMWCVLQNVPYVKRHARSMIDSMIGATLAPFLSAITLFVGWTYVSTTPIPSLEEWISVLGIVALAGAWPVLLAPMLTHAVSPVQRSIETAVMSSSMMAMQMGMGAAGGAMAGASGTAGGLGGRMKAALGGMAGGMASAGIGSMPEAKQLAQTGIQTSGITAAGPSPPAQDPQDPAGRPPGWLPPLGDGQRGAGTG